MKNRKFFSLLPILILVVWIGISINHWISERDKKEQSEEQSTNNETIVSEDSVGAVFPPDIRFTREWINETSKDSLLMDSSGNVWWPRPKMVHRIGICYIGEQEHVIHLETTKALVDSLKLNQFGDCSYWGEHDFYRLRVDSRYDFDEVLTYLRQF